MLHETVALYTLIRTGVEVQVEKKSDFLAEEIH